MDRQRWEQSGCISFDTLLVGWLTTCTSCGTPVPPLDQVGECRILDGLDRWVVIVLCPACAQHWEQRLEGEVLAMLQGRYAN